MSLNPAPMTRHRYACCLRGLPQLAVRRRPRCVGGFRNRSSNPVGSTGYLLIIALATVVIPLFASYYRKNPRPNAALTIFLADAICSVVLEFTLPKDGCSCRMTTLNSWIMEPLQAPTFRRSSISPLSPSGIPKLRSVFKTAMETILMWILWRPSCCFPLFS